ncbi:hypothetical protein CEXT_343851 [Caerostris extrusa]|uniref:Uncharacterized protein n=1 Tax=Caerostris extrusa TaxID=172846 RepID=A0AAV4UUV7_CAEEX|nr:hypothetical protein CEXT_343851 [Caerostris extrusa]
MTVAADERSWEQSPTTNCCDLKNATDEPAVDRYGAMPFLHQACQPKISNGLRYSGVGQLQRFDCVLQTVVNRNIDGPTELSFNNWGLLWTMAISPVGQP